jgi:hypothetical protein
MTRRRACESGGVAGGGGGDCCGGGDHSTGTEATATEVGPALAVTMVVAVMDDSHRRLSACNSMEKKKTNFVS